LSLLTTRLDCRTGLRRACYYYHCIFVHTSSCGLAETLSFIRFGWGTSRSTDCAPTHTHIPRIAGTFAAARPHTAPHHTYDNTPPRPCIRPRLRTLHAAVIALVRFSSQLLLSTGIVDRVVLLRLQKHAATFSPTPSVSSSSNHSVLS